MVCNCKNVPHKWMCVFPDLIKKKENVGQHRNPFTQTYQMERPSETYLILVQKAQQKNQNWSFTCIILINYSM